MSADETPGHTFAKLRDEDEEDKDISNDLEKQRKKK